ncbi:MAG: phosphotriesterase, partial [Verrucomicrobiae bacterium]|nr:phosphotriesterase [Verrucomicrobiae bacterium]
MPLPMTRRDFLRSTSLALAAAGCATPATPAAADEGRILTVTGPIPAERLDRTLIHEHVVVDFIGAARTSPDRYDPEKAFETALPHFRELRARGIASLVECTPRFIGRNPALLRRLSEASGVQIVTNTGWYAAVDHKFLPGEAATATADRIANLWLEDW